MLCSTRRNFHSKDLLKQICSLFSYRATLILLRKQENAYSRNSLQIANVYCKRNNNIVNHNWIVLTVWVFFSNLVDVVFVFALIDYNYTIIWFNCKYQHWRWALRTEWDTKRYTKRQQSKLPMARISNSIYTSIEPWIVSNQTFSAAMFQQTNMLRVNDMHFSNFTFYSIRDDVERVFFSSRYQ